MSFKPSKEFLKCYPYYKDFNKKSNTRKKSKKKVYKRFNIYPL